MNPVRIDRQILLTECRASDVRWLSWLDNGGPVAAYIKKQVALPPNATPDDYDAVSIANGRGYATYTKCNGCDRYVAAVVRVGQDPDDCDNLTAYLCRDCLIEALALLPEPVEVQP